MVIWTNNAVENMQEFIEDARNDTQEVARAYMNRLVDYAETLEKFKNLGTDIEVAFKLKYELKMLVFESHKIVYTIKNDKIYILAVVHSKLDFNKVLKRLNKNL